MSIQQAVPCFTLNDGHKIPAIGCGTYLISVDEVSKMVETAIKVGYRHIDCAETYGNEEGVGRGIKKCIEEGIVRREELFVTSKLWIDHKEEVKKAVKETLKKLELEYLDLYLIHEPITLKKGAGYPPKKEDVIDIPIEETWKQMEELVHEGLVRSIGVSNFNISHMEEVMKIATIKPAVNQVEMNIYYQQPKLKEWSRKHHVHLTAFSPFGSVACTGFRKKDAPNVFEDKEVQSIAAKYQRTVGQILVKFYNQEGCSAIPKSVHEERLRSNLSINDFVIKEEDMILLKKINRNYSCNDLEGFCSMVGIDKDKYFKQDD